MRAGFILILISLNCQLAIAQDYYGWISFAEQASQEGDHLGAVIYYESAFALDSSRQELQFALAEAYEKAGYYNDAHRLFMKVYSKGRGRFFPKGPVHIAQLKMYRGEYEAAIEFWRRALRRTEIEDEQKLIEQRMRSCSYALSNPLAEEDIIVSSLSEMINSTDSEYGIEWSGDSLVFFSSLRGTYNENWELDSSDTYFARIYSSQADSYGFSEVSEVELSNAPIDKHQLYPSLSKDGSKLIFSLCDDKGHCQLALARKAVKGFEFLRYLEESYGDVGSNSQAQIIEQGDKDYLIFTSDRSSGYGGTDIWIAELKDDELIDVQNLGSRINSAGNELTPYYDQEEEKLYFSSDYHPGYGAYDIFSVDYRLGEQSQESPKNLGLPINSSVKDLFYKEKGSSRYLTSNRAGSLSEDSTHCCTDIFEVKEFEADSSIVNEDRIVPESIESVDELKGLLPISLYFHNDVPDPGSQSNTTEISYDLTVDDYLDLKNRYLEEYSTGQNDSLGMLSRESMNKFFQDQVVSEFEKLVGVSRLLLKELDKGSRIEIAIKGYASPLAQSDYNRKLTQRRIQSIINYLKELDEGALRKYMNGDDPELKIRAIPFGEEESDEFVSDNPLDAKNSIYSIAAMRERRVEILRIQEQ